jgi:hypothetical protein
MLLLLLLLWRAADTGLSLELLVPSGDQAKCQTRSVCPSNVCKGSSECARVAMLPGSILLQRHRAAPH